MIFYEMIGNYFMMSADKNKYNEYIKRYIYQSKDRGYYITFNELRTTNNFRLPNPEWLVNNCPNKKCKKF